ncbi:malonyl-CoA synthase [uncultured Jannaschia sp.]|uniref:malonate--CoA ligase n=1 Tax=uncultured Jannaschia sp. TaxID=293347 RepID=UPI002627104A|nr:malonyl-CoA synthase [uncultured Jannaschia sp.]
MNPLYDRLFGRHASRDAPFLHLSDGRAISHRDFGHMAGRMANALAARGLVPGDRVAAQIDKSPEALALYAACARAGLVFLPLNTAYTADEVGYFVTDSGARLFVCDPGRAGEMAEVAKAAGATLATLSGDGRGSLAEDAASAPSEFATVARGGSDLAAFLYTSGTTGRSKGAMLSQDNLLSNAETLAEAWRFTEGDVLLHALPIFHTHGLFVATNVTLVAGGAMIFLPKFDAGEMIAQLPRATAMMGVPTFYTRLLAEPRFDRDLVAHMRLFVSGSAPLLSETHRAFTERTGHRILERYGMTETNMNTSNPYEGERRAGTVGQPLPGVELRIMDGGVEVAPGETGTIEVRGPNVFQGYWNMPEKTAEELRPDGWFITGDLGTRSEDGYVTIVGRGKDLIISGGFNIYPKEVELLLDDQPGVLESAVVGVPHPDFGESPVAVLVPAPGAAPDVDAIRAAVKDGLARFKHPARYEVVDELPRNTMGKVQKNVLRDRYAGAFG